MEDGKYVDGSIWFYAPAKPAPIIFATLFLISGLLHFYQCHLYKSWRSTGVLPWCSLLFVVGYVLRAVGAWNYDNFAIYISSTVFIYAAPPAYELSNYVTLSRLLHYIPHHSPIHPGRIITTFLGLSIFVEVFTANGAARAANPDNTPGEIAVGKALLKTALILQLVIMVIFIAAAVHFQRKCSRSGMLAAGQPARRPVVGVLITLYCSCVLILIRTIYRTVEYFTAANLHVVEGMDPNTLSPILRYEWFFWVFEGTLMVINSFLLNARHPGRYLPSDKYVYLTPSGEERHGEKHFMEDHRKGWVKTVDPFDFVGLVKGTDKNRRWWEGGEQNVEVVNVSGPAGRCGK